MTFAAYLDELTHYPPQAVTAGCLQWARQKPGWPSLSELIAFIEVNNRSAAALPAPGEREDFLTRCKRVGGRDALWQREHHHLLEAAFADHLEDRLTDEHLAVGLQEAAAGRFAQPEPRPKAKADWRANDNLGAELAAEPDRYWLGRALAGVFSRFRSKRFADHPAEARGYYGADQ